MSYEFLTSVGAILFGSMTTKEASKATGNALTPEVARLLSPSYKAFPAVLPAQNHLFTGMVQRARQQAASVRSLSYQQQIASLQTTVSSEVLDRIRAYGAENISPGMSSRLQDAMTSAVYLGHDADNAILSLTAAKKAVLDMISGDKRLAGFVSDPRNEKLVTRMRERLMGSTFQEAIGMLTSFGQAAEDHISGFGDIFSYYHRSNMRLLSSSRASEKIPAAIGLRLDNSNLVMGAMSRFKEFDTMPSSTRDLAMNQLSQAERDKLAEYQKALNERLKGRFQFNPGRGDIYEIQSSIGLPEGSKPRSFRYARVKVNNGEINLPLGEAGDYFVGQPGQAQGHIYFRGKAGSTMYSPVGKVINIDNTGVDIQSTPAITGHDNIWNPQTGKYLDVIEKLESGEIRSAEEILFSSADQGDEAVRYMEEIDPTKNPLIAIAKKHSQILLQQEREIVGIEPIERFNAHREIAQRQGISLFPMAGPKQQDKGIYHWAAETGGTLDVPLYTGSALGELKSSIGGVVPESIIPLGRRPNRWMNNPLQVVDPGTTRALDRVTQGSRVAGGVKPTARLLDLYTFRNGAFKGMLDSGLEPFVTGAVFSTPRGQARSPEVFLEGSRGLLNPLAEEEGTFIRPGRRTVIETGTQEYPFEFNPKLEEFLNSPQIGSDANPVERQKFLADLQNRSGVTFEEGEFLGRRRLSNGSIENTFVDVGGTNTQGRVVLQDIIPFEGGYKLAFGREVPAGAGKLEGGTKSNQHFYDKINEAVSAQTTKINADFDEKIKIAESEVEKKHQERLKNFDENSKKAQWGKQDRAEELERIERARQNALDKRVQEINLERRQALEQVQSSPEVVKAIEENKQQILSRVQADSAEGPMSEGTKKAYDKATETFTADVTHLAEGKEIYKDGNLLAVRGQQQYATSLLTGQSLESVLPSNERLVAADFGQQLGLKVSDNAILKDFQEAAMSLSLARGGRYSERDTNALLALLKRVNSHLDSPANPNHRINPYQQAVFGYIFGLEQKGTGFPGLIDMMDERPEATKAMLGALGFSKERTKNLRKGIEEAGVVVGLNVQSSRDFSLDSTNDAKVERRYIEEIYDSTRSMFIGPEERAMLNQGVYTTRVMNPYRDFHSFVFGQILNSNIPLDREYTRAIEDMGMGLNSRPVQTGKAGEDLVVDLHTKIAPEEYAVKMAERRAKLLELKEQGGFLKFSENSMAYIPSARLVDASTIKSTRSGKLTEDLRLKNIISRIFSIAEKNVEKMDDEVVQLLHESINEFSRGVYGEMLGITTHLIESPLSGWKHETVYGAEVNTSIPKHHRPYQLGLSRSRIDKEFDARIAKAEAAGRTHEVAFLKNYKKEVLEGKAAIPVLGGQSPSIGPEHMSMFVGKYDPTRDKQGGVSMPQYGEWRNEAGQEVPANTPGSKYIRMGGTVTGKSSADDDGDTALIKMAEVSPEDEHLLTTEEGVKEAYGKLTARIEDPALLEQYERQASYSANQSAFNSVIKGSLADKLGANGSTSLDEVQKAFMRWAGQEEIGQTSNATNELRFIKRILEETGAITRVEAEDMSSFLNAMEQNAVGFKHLDRTIGSVFSESVGRILSEPNPERRAANFKDFFDSFFYTDKGGQKINFLLPERTEEQMQGLVGGLARAKVTQSSLEATKKAEDIKPMSVLRSLESGDQGSFAAMYSTASPAQRNALLSSAVNSLPESQRDAEKERLRQVYEEQMSDHQRMLSEANAATIAEAERRQREGGIPSAMGSLDEEIPGPSYGSAGEDAAPRIMNEEVRASNAEQKFMKNMRSEMSIAAEDAKGLLENKFARTIGIGAAAMAGIYALFTKGYDDEPLSDIPPPPSNYGMNGNAQMEPLTGGGSLVSDSYRRQSMDMADAMGADYSESNIPAPTSIMKRSYLDGATARISSRSLNLDRTNPVEYARSLRQAIPGSSIGLNINTSYSVPTDLERKL